MGDNTYLCITCKQDKQVSFEEIKKHLLEGYKIDITKQSCQQELESHFDAKEFYSSVYKYTFPDGTVIKHFNTEERDREDMMYWEDLEEDCTKKDRQEWEGLEEDSNG